MPTATVKQLKEFLADKNDDDRVYFRSPFETFDIRELKDTDNNNYPLDGYVVFRGKNQ